MLGCKVAETLADEIILILENQLVIMENIKNINDDRSTGNDAEKGV